VDRRLKENMEGALVVMNAEKEHVISLHLGLLVIAEVD
jgi:hypothetical protein